MANETAFGSEWKKWDLHLHSPFTKLNDNYECISNEDIWKTFCDKLENSDVAVLGLTDYFCAENYFTLLEKHTQYFPDSNKVLFPNIEFRLDVSVNKKAEEVNIHVIFSNEVTKEKINEFLQKLDTNITREDGSSISCKSLSGISEYKKAGIKYTDLKSVLLKVFGNQKTYLICAAANNAGLRPESKSPRKLNITDEIDKLCDGFFGGQQNVGYYLNSDRYETDEKANAKPVVCGCDAHSFTEIDDFLGKRFTKDNPTEIIKDICWIKADLSFEGLKQILYEPKYRISIGDIEPRKPIRKLNSIKFNFPADTTIKKQNSNEYQGFCLSNLKNEIYFSPYFTCFIGGRGTGKSTIINLIAKRLGNPTEFFGKGGNELFTGNPKVKYDIQNDLNNYIHLDGTNDIEFVSQGRVEDLTEGESLANLIFQERILETNTDLKTKQNELNDLLEVVSHQVKSIFSLEDTINQIEEKQKELKKHKNVVDSINDPAYKTIISAIGAASNEKTAIENSISEYQSLLDRVKTVIQETNLDYSIENEYGQRIEQVLEHLLTIEELKLTEEEIQVTPKKFEITDNTKKELELTIESEQKKLSEFFKEKGTSEESIKDSQNSNQSIARIQADIINLNSKKESLETQIQEKNGLIEELENLQNSITTVIENEITELNNKLKRTNENISSIRYDYAFNYETYKESLCNDFTETFKSYRKPNMSWDYVYDILLLIEPDKSILAKSYADFYDELENKIINKKHTLYGSIISEIFSMETNFIIYKLLIRKHLFDSFKHVQITGYYGTRQLQICSFGQKCTAVIVTLLMTGVKPLIIDEPEAHLDNRLIADYLVELIKDKKPDRQIIFATHNANFVINGDAELIHILEMPEDGNFTSITSTTIENVNYRDKLLKLEGGKEAFEKREKKLL